MPTPESLDLPLIEAKAAGMGRGEMWLGERGCLLTKQLVELAAFRGRRESLRPSSVRKAKNRVGKEGREGGEEGKEGTHEVRQP